MEYPYPDRSTSHDSSCARHRPPDLGPGLDLDLDLDRGVRSIGAFDRYRYLDRGVPSVFHRYRSGYSIDRSNGAFDRDGRRDGRDREGAVCGTPRRLSTIIMFKTKAPATKTAVKKTAPKKATPARKAAAPKKIVRRTEEEVSRAR